MLGSIVDATRAVSGKTIRLTYRQWMHIVEAHDYMAGCLQMIMETINLPDMVAIGKKRERIALKNYPDTFLGKKYCVVVYRENGDGFVITAFLTSKPKTLTKGGLIWPK